MNLQGQVNRNGEICFDLVPLYFSSNQFVHVNEVYMQFSSKLSDLNGFIATSLIDKSPVNQYQQLLFFQSKNKSRNLYYSPTHLARYKIQTQNLQSATFKLSLFESTEKIDFRKVTIDVYLQLQIETNAGVLHQSSAAK